MSGAGRASSGPMRDDLWRLDGRVALVTGASSGLGAPFAEQRLRPYVAKGQKQARGSKDFLAPATAKKIAQVQRFYKTLTYLPVKHVMKYLTTRTATGIELPDYPGLDRSRQARGSATA